MNQKASSERMAEAMARARRLWHARPRAEPAARPPPIPVPPAWTIALSREAGANGPLVAHAVGERLGWMVYDRELLERIAGEMGVRASLLESVDERQRDWLRECLQGFSSSAAVSASAYVRYLVETLLSLAAHGECVIVGRGAAQVLPVATTLRVRLVGPEAERVKAIRQRFCITQEEAVRWVKKTDAERTRFVQEHSRKDPADPCLYDLVLNASRYSVGECAELIVDALRCLQERPAPSHPVLVG
jgi:cytidylate kinase